MSNTPPTNWAKFYHQNLSSADATTTATTDSDSTSMMITSTNLSGPSHGSSTSNLNPSEGRVSKPAHTRRRSRASSRTPTTLLNTDTTNFRAMVQQFTGDPNVSFASTPPVPSFSFALGEAGNRHNPNPNPNPNPNRSSSSLMFSPGYRLQYQPQYQGQGYMISMSNVNNHAAAAGDHGFFRRLGGNPRPPQQPPETGSDGVLMEMNINASSSSRAAPSNSSGNRGNGFMF